MCMRPLTLPFALGLLLSACTPGDAARDRSGREELSTPGDEELPSRGVQSLGVATRSVSDSATARKLGLPRVIRGAFIDRVIRRTPAAAAGLKRGDVITEIRVGRGAEQIGYSVDAFVGLDDALRRLEHLNRFTVEVFRGPAPLNRSSYATQLFRVSLESRSSGCAFPAMRPTYLPWSKNEQISPPRRSYDEEIDRAQLVWVNPDDPKEGVGLTVYPNPAGVPEKPIRVFIDGAEGYLHNGSMGEHSTWWDLDARCNFLELSVSLDGATPRETDREVVKVARSLRASD